MLLRVVIILLFAVAFATGEKPSVERQLIGTWVSVEYPAHLAVYLNYRPDHTEIIRYANGTPPYVGTWRVDGGMLISIRTTGPWRGESDKCKFVIRRDRLIFGEHRTTRKLDGHRVGEPEFWMSGVTYRRVRGASRI